MHWFNPARLHRIERILWAAVLVCLPVTSLRSLSFLGADTQVKPLSIVPAALLLVLLAWRSVRERRWLLWSGSFQPLLVFVIVALFSTAVGIYLAPANLYTYSYAGRTLRAWATLAVGLLFLVLPFCMNQDEADLKFTLKWLYIGLIPEVAWSAVQLVAILTRQDGWVDALQKTVMMAGLPPNNRISGLALEPSWLASQVMTLYLPWAFASVTGKYEWTKRRWVAPCVLAACAFLLIFTYSRGGILTAVAALGLTFLIVAWERVRRAWDWLVRPLRPATRTLGALLLRLAVVGVFLAGLAGGVTILSRNSYFAQLWQSTKTNSLVSYFVDIYAGPRLAYSWAGWTIFSQHPLTGVGLGAAGFSMFPALPDWAHFNISEIAQLLSPDNAVYPNIKNLYVRLLAETGVFGFWAFISFYLLMLGKIFRALHSRRSLEKYVGTALLVAWIGIVVLALTQDSLAMPNIWLPFGILIGLFERRRNHFVIAAEPASP